MRTEVSEIKELTDSVPPDGAYQGVWSGYVVRFVGEGRTFEAKTTIGVRGRCECVVTVDQGNVIIHNGYVGKFNKRAVELKG